MLNINADNWDTVDESDEESQIDSDFQEICWLRYPGFFLKICII